MADLGLLLGMHLNLKLRWARNPMRTALSAIMQEVTEMKMMMTMYGRSVSGGIWRSTSARCGSRGSQSVV
jgi:hypothetical protein